MTRSPASGSAHQPSAPPAAATAAAPPQAEQGEPRAPPLGQAPQQAPDLSTMLFLEEHDLLLLFAAYLQRVAGGAPLSLSTFKSVWTSLRFSYIFSVS